jgi:anti-sigma factor RsiW
MNCENIHELAPLWHSREMEGAQLAAFDGHVAECAACGAELRRQTSEDLWLRNALAPESADTRALEFRVMRQISRERMQRWLIAGIAAAAAVVLTVFAMGHRAQPVNPAIFADAARDHTAEVIDKGQRRWRTEPSDIKVLQTAQGISEVDVKALEAKGYKLQRAKICRLGGTPYMHFVYAKGAREFSVYLKTRADQALPEAESSSGSLQLASFSRGKVQAVIVTDASRSECAQFAKAAEGAL